MPGETLPPVVAVLQGDISDLVSKIGAAKAEVESMDDVTGTAQVGVDSTVGDQVAAATAEVEAFGALREDAHIGVDSSALSGAIAGAVGAGIAGGMSGGGSGGSVLSTLGWGGGIWGFAAFGSILSLMGFSLEHFVATALGLIGSAAGALAGGALLALGSLSILGVGTVTDLGGIGQAMGDIKTTYTALSTYQTMQQALAKQIPQTAAAQAALNAALAGFAPAAQSAVLAASLTASQFHWMYDQVTGTAEAIGANILNQAMQVGEAFLPILGRFATINMGIIQSGLQPLFQFLGTTGITVFTELENIFTARLPTAIHALDQGVELLVKSMGFLATQTTGGFMTWLNTFLTNLNTPAGFQKLEGVFVTLIAMSKDWWDLLKQVAITLYDLFKPSAGLGTSIVTTLTSMLKSLDAYLTSVTGSAELHNVFTVHKAEAIALLGFLGTLLSVGGQIGLVLIPPFVSLATILLNMANTLLHIPFAGTVLAWAAAAAFLWSRLKLVAVATLLMRIPGAVMASWAFITLLPTRIGLLLISLRGLAVSAWTAVAGMYGMAAAALSAAAAFVVERTAAVLAWIATLGPIALIVAAIAAVGVAIYLLVTHWKQVSTVVGQVMANVVGAVGTAVGAIASWFSTIPGDIAKVFGSLVSIIVSPFETAFKDIANLWNSTIGKVSFKIPGWVPGIGNDAFSFPKMAVGGPVIAGMPYIVGESGQELFVPNQNGSIVPNNALGMGRPINVTFETTVNGSGLTQSQMSAAIASAWNQIAGRMQQQLLAAG
jgi:hypothetical protein